MVNAAEKLAVMERVGDTRHIFDMARVAHSLHLVVAGALIKKKKKKRGQVEEISAWARSG
ncbi:hypothetical protein PC116_g2525 [Phytophthora cactorum]|uniref:Uncharacterized protein n=1 Tax=Phytophthora cactorum TaxID=29920 RepID=A0A8T1LSM1_9STRA|nr:hypothetical protein Pcac1_g4679 [Phytophthora cactorum]KAG2845923.1 hypothetical protein PC111_g1375 [Phytophthora cactorum]KAG2932402.1 hypothetical protein PC114_g1829 [Phytophthora cactorum]KAG2953625.1 hypothetical protein PC117_g1889 [Phytophthora cactorum]KAG3039769.1 hypothetical protein PC119_g1910 [Phytophthora cactorum]